MDDTALALAETVCKTCIDSLAPKFQLFIDKIKELEQENKELRQITSEWVSSKPSESEVAVGTLIDLIAPDIEWQEQHNPNSAKLAPVFAAYRAIRPKERAMSNVG